MRDPFTFEERVALWVLAALLAMLCFVALNAFGADAPPVPKTMPLPNPPRIYYFIAQQTDAEGKSSEWSKEYLWTNFTKARVVQFELEPGMAEYPISNYSVAFGKAARVYTATNHYGTNLIGTIRLAKEPLTNRVFVVSTTSTGMYHAATLNGPWTYTPETNAVHLNPRFGNRFYKPVLGGALTWKEVWF